MQATRPKLQNSNFFILMNLTINIREKTWSYTLGCKKQERFFLLQDMLLLVRVIIYRHAYITGLTPLKRNMNTKLTLNQFDGPFQNSGAQLPFCLAISSIGSYGLHRRNQERRGQKIKTDRVTGRQRGKTVLITTGALASKNKKCKKNMLIKFQAVSQ